MTKSWVAEYLAHTLPPSWFQNWFNLHIQCSIYYRDTIIFQTPGTHLSDYTVS